MRQRAFGSRVFGQRVIAGLLLACAVSTVQAASVILDYEGVPSDPGSFATGGAGYFPPGNNSWDEDGFRTAGVFDNSPASILFGSEFDGNEAWQNAGNSVAVRVNSLSASISITQINGDPFAALSIDISENCLAVCGRTGGFIIGEKLGGGSVSLSYELDDIQGPETFDLLGFDIGFGSIVSLGWTTDINVGQGLRSQLDNVVLNTSPIPLPATFWLFASALVGFVGMARRTKIA